MKAAPITSAPIQGKPGRPAAAAMPVQPRLLSVEGAAAYLSVSTAQVYHLLNAGVVNQVTLPVQRDRRGGAIDGACRRVLIDREELDALIPRWKSKRADP